MKVTIGLAQIAPVLGDVDHNLQLHLETIRSAAAQGIELLIFPELGLTGYQIAERAPDVAIRATADDPVFSRLLAASQSLDLIVSFVEQDSRQRYFIAAAYLSAGRLVHLHRKVYLPTYGLFEEAKHFAYGKHVRAFDTRFGRLGILICEDYWHPSTAYLLWQDGAEAILMIASSVEHGEPDQPEASTAATIEAIQRSYALLFTTFVVHVNRAGAEPAGRYWGGSTVYGPDGKLMARARPYEPDLAAVELDLEALRAARIRLPLLRDERPELMLRELQRIVAAD